ncbi:hypothetical protein T4D_538 [Trichinella pseudospiralis]|uniref:Uncharacterized protein n=1 Tax=Trichinella pseudospiralis TaxID=6337 RepID=A0A0V1FYA0_TRIPS|nr:hypothetical protein T4D_538 [Trichinella pseudospiralis]
MFISHLLSSPVDADVPEYCRDCCKALASSKLEEDDVLPICHRLGPARVSRAVPPGSRVGFHRSRRETMGWSVRRDPRRKRDPA